MILFLDFDGVLNHPSFLRHERARGGSLMFSPINVAALNALTSCVAFDAIVVSSSWRIGRSIAQLQQLLSDGGVLRTELVVATTGPEIHGATGRRDEIEHWLGTQHERPRSVAIDDMFLGPSWSESANAGEQGEIEHCVTYQVRQRFGLCDEDVSEILKLSVAKGW